MKKYTLTIIILLLAAGFADTSSAESASYVTLSKLYATNILTPNENAATAKHAELYGCVKYVSSMTLKQPIEISLNDKPLVPCAQSKSISKNEKKLLYKTILNCDINKNKSSGLKNSSNKKRGSSNFINDKTHRPMAVSSAPFCGINDDSNPFTQDNLYNITTTVSDNQGNSQTRVFAGKISATDSDLLSFTPSTSVFPANDADDLNLSWELSDNGQQIPVPMSISLDDINGQLISNNKLNCITGQTCETTFHNMGVHKTYDITYQLNNEDNEMSILQRHVIPSLSISLNKSGIGQHSLSPNRCLWQYQLQISTQIKSQIPQIASCSAYPAPSISEMRCMHQSNGQICSFSGPCKEDKTHIAVSCSTADQFGDSGSISFTLNQ